MIWRKWCLKRPFLNSLFTKSEVKPSSPRKRGRMLEMPEISESRVYKDTWAYNQRFTGTLETPYIFSYLFLHLSQIPRYLIQGSHLFHDVPTLTPSLSVQSSCFREEFAKGQTRPSSTNILCSQITNCSSPQVKPSFS